MGYSNNKWRKIFTILMIINLCFILFAKISKVFAYDYTLDDTVYTFPDYPPNFDTSNLPYKLVILRKFGAGTSSNPYDFEVNYFYSDSPFNTERYNGHNDVIANSNTYLFSFNYNSNRWSAWNRHISTGYTMYSLSDTYLAGVLFSSHDIYYNNTLVIAATPTFVYPFFDNVTDISNGYPDGVYISVGDYANTDNLYFHLLQIDTGLSNSDTSIYYYTDKVFLLNKNSKYYKTWKDPNIEGYYYYIPRYKLGLSQNTSYLYVLNNSNEQIENSYGIYEKDTTNGIYDVVQSDTAGVITATEEESDRMKNIEQSLVDNHKSMGTIENTLTDSHVSQDTETNIDDNLTFNNSAPNFSNLYSSFFSRLSDTITSLSDYDLSEIETINFPIPFTQRTIPLTSNIVSQNMPEFLTTLFTMFWLFIFGKYFLAYILFIYRLIASGRILDNINSNNEIITNDVL